MMKGETHAKVDKQQDERGDGDGDGDGDDDKRDVSRMDSSLV
jgi:hypothetical protein